MKNEIEIFAHRGLNSQAPENTLPAFRLAAQLPIKGIELDVQLSKDNKVVVVHDEILERLTNGKGYVKDHTYEELRKLDAGSWFSEEYKGEHIPLLEEVFELYKSNELTIIIELKTATIEYEGIEEKVRKLIEDYKMMKRVIISSFNHYSLIRIKRLNPHIRTAILTGDIIYKPSNYLDLLGADTVHGSIYALNQEMIDDLKQNFKGLCVYTVNREDDLHRLMSMGVRAVITDKPDVFAN